jgi:fatty-acid peroxygenase
VIGVGGAAGAELFYDESRFERTNHDPQLWADPQRFDPSRFLTRTSAAYDLIAQGGGDPHTGHRCAGESATIALMKQAAKVLSTLDYQVPPQDLTIPLRRMPSKVGSGFLMTNKRERDLLGTTQKMP